MRTSSTGGMIAQVIETSSERALEYITGDKPVIFDPLVRGIHRTLRGSCDARQIVA